MDFNSLTEDYSLIDTTPCDIMLTQACASYPWFSLAHYALARKTGRGSEALDIRLQIKPYPTILAEEKEHIDYYSPNTGNIEDAINFFEELPSQSNIPCYDSEPQTYDISAQSVAFDDEIATETLAQIYLAQGHRDRAIEIYLKLSLKNPEKSSYFAELINNISG